MVMKHYPPEFKAAPSPRTEDAADAAAQPVPDADPFNGHQWIAAVQIP